MRINLDYFLVTVDKKYESSVRDSGIITVNDAWVDKTLEETYDRFQYKRIYGRVESCPLGYSDTTVSLVDPGIPAPRKYISHDMISAKVKEGYKHYGRHNYCPSTFEDFKKKTLRDVGRRLSIERFDTIYFDYRVTEDENLVGKHEGKDLYKVRADQIICSVKDGEIIPQGGWCLVEPNMETWEEITTKSGILMKSAPQAKYLEGIVRYISPLYNIKAGDKILYEIAANWTVNVEGKDYYAIEEEDILGKFVKEEDYGTI